MTSNIVRLPDQGRPAVDGEGKLIADWLHRVMRKGDGAGPFSAERLCRKAGTSPTNITRFLRDGYPVPKMSTLSKLAEAAGVPPPTRLLVTEAQPYVDVPVILPILHVSKGMRAAIMLATNTTRAPAKYAECVAFMVTVDTASLAGVLVGDLVICDWQAVPADNDLVGVALPDGKAGVYRVRGDWLEPQAAGNLPALRKADATIIGVARQIQRELR